MVLSREDRIPMLLRGGKQACSNNALLETRLPLRKGVRGHTHGGK
jgi:hypothetical protein